MPRRISAAGVALIAAGLLLSTDRLAAQHPPHWRFFTSSDGLRESWVLDVTPGSNGRWWVTHGNVDSLSVFDGYTIRQLPSPGATVTVREGPTGQLWSLLPHPTVLDAYIGVQLLQNDRWTAYPLQDLPAGGGSMRRWHLLPWAHDRVLVLCPDAILEFDRATGAQTTLVRAADTGLRTFSELTPAADGGAWIGGRGAIGRLAPPGKAGRPTLAENRAPPALAAASVVQIHEARPDTVFVSVLSGGGRAALRVDADAWREVTRVPPGTEDRIESWEGLPGEVWTARSGLRSFHLGVGSGTGPPIDIERTSPLSGRLNAVRSAGQGAFWLATSLGLARHAPAAWRSPPELGEAVGHVATLFQTRRASCTPSTSDTCCGTAATCGRSCLCRTVSGPTRASPTTSPSCRTDAFSSARTRGRESGSPSMARPCRPSIHAMDASIGSGIPKDVASNWWLPERQGGPG